MLTDKQLEGIDTVVVTKLNIETFIESDKAKILKIYQGDRQGVHAKVIIGNDVVDRWIFARDQKSN